MFQSVAKRGLSALVVALCSIAMALAFVPAQALAAGNSRSLVGSDVIDAGALPLNKTTSRTITSEDPIRYSVTTTSNSILKVTGTASDAITLHIFSANGEDLTRDNFQTNSVTGKATIDREYCLNTGSYYITFENTWVLGAGQSMDFSFNASLTSTGTTFDEKTGGSDNGMSKAWSIDLDKSYKGQFSLDEATYYTSDDDYYKFTLTKASEIMVSASNTDGCGLRLYLYDANGDQCESFIEQFDEKKGKTTISGKTDVLDPGTYYVRMSPFYKGNEGVYTFKLRPVNTMYRLYNPNSGEHFYTASEAERNSVVKSGWKYEGEGWNAPVTSGAPVYRLYSGTDHHYTTSAAERDNLKKAGWKYEGIGWYSDESKTVPLYRQFNPNVNPKAAKNNSGSHNYTTSKGENDSLVKTGWKAEGIGWYGC